MIASLSRAGLGMWMLLAAGSAPALADSVVARVAGTEIRESDVKLAETDIGDRMPAMTEEAKKDYILTYLTDLVTLSKEAESRKIQDTPEFARKLAYARQRVLMDILLTTEGKAALSDEAMKKVYEDAKAKTAGQKEVKARHILVETEEEAKAIAADLKKGKDFAELAKEKSKDPGSGAQGGDLGYFTKDRMVPEFAEVAFRLKPGETSDPVKSQFGWHIIRVEEQRDRPFPPMDQVKEQLETYVMGKAQSDMVMKLREKYKPERVGTAAPSDKPADAAKETPKSGK